jgi:hypothetical protein
MHSPTTSGHRHVSVDTTATNKLSRPVQDCEGWPAVTDVLGRHSLALRGTEFQASGQHWPDIHAAADPTQRLTVVSFATPRSVFRHRVETKRVGLRFYWIHLEGVARARKCRVRRAGSCSRHFAEAELHRNISARHRSTVALKTVSSARSSETSYRRRTRGMNPGSSSATPAAAHSAPNCRSQARWPIAGVVNAVHQ